MFIEIYYIHLPYVITVVVIYNRKIHIYNALKGVESTTSKLLRHFCLIK